MIFIRVRLFHLDITVVLEWKMVCRACFNAAASVSHDATVSFTSVRPPRTISKVLGPSCSQWLSKLWWKSSREGFLLIHTQVLVCFSFTGSLSLLTLAMLLSLLHVTVHKVWLHTHPLAIHLAASFSNIFSVCLACQCHWCTHHPPPHHHPCFCFSPINTSQLHRCP